MQKPATYRRTIIGKGARVRVHIESAPFDPKKHRCRLNGNNDVEIDGFRALGADDIPPRAKSMVTRLEVTWNGRRVPIPARVWKQLLDAPLTDALAVDDGNVGARLSDDGASLLLSLGGGDGAGSYERWWVIRRDGVVAAFTQGPE